jgi:hypothetical protein
MAKKLYTKDAGAFVVGQLQKIDQTLHLPTSSVTYGRDLPLRTDVGIGHTASSWTNTTYGSPGGIGGKSKHWAGLKTTNAGSTEIATAMTIQQLYPWAEIVEYSLWELESAKLLGTPIDTQKILALKEIYNLEVDNQAFIGDTDVTNNGAAVTGLANSAVVTNSTNAVTGGWSSATPTQILADIRELEQSVWAATAWAYAPTRLLVDPVSFSYLQQAYTITTGGTTVSPGGSIREFISRNSMCMAVNGKELEIFPNKWLAAGYATSTKRMIAYTPDYDKVRFPLVPLQRTAPWYLGTSTQIEFYGKVGQVEIVYPTSIGYRSNL